MARYRDDLDAARTRIAVLEARLAEKDAELGARDASLKAREEELRAVLRVQAMQGQGHSGEPPPDTPSPRTARWGAMLLGMMTLTLSVGVSEAYDRIGRAERALSRAQREMQLVQADTDFAIASLRAEAGRLRRALAPHEGSTLEAVDVPLAPGERKARLLSRLDEEPLEEADRDLLRLLCERDHDMPCLERLERRDAL